MIPLPTKERDFEASLAWGQHYLQDNEYPGRWLAMGRGEGSLDDQLVVAYSFGGRSEGSRNRRAIQDGDAIRLVAPGISAEEMDAVSDAALIYYHAMDTRDGVHVVSNGAQTPPILDAIAAGASLEEAVQGAPTVPGMMDGKPVDIDLSSFEPDRLHTPRITGVIDLRPNASTPFGFAVARRFADTDLTVRSYAGYDDLDRLRPGWGFAIQTYAPRNPWQAEPPSFDRPPYGFRMEGDAKEIASRIQKAIGETFAATVVRVIDATTGEITDQHLENTR